MISSGQQCNCTFFKELPAGCSLFYKRTNPSSCFQPEGSAPSSKGKDKEQEDFFPCVACPYSIARFLDMGKQKPRRWYDAAPGITWSAAQNRTKKILCLQGSVYHAPCIWATARKEVLSCPAKNPPQPMHRAWWLTTATPAAAARPSRASRASVGTARPTPAPTA